MFRLRADRDVRALYGTTFSPIGGVLIQQTSEGESAPPSPATIMVVEPEILVRMLIADYLRQCGYTVIEAGTAEDALTVLSSDVKVEVVFAEVLALGPGDGFGLAKQIREDHPEVDVILTSGVTNAAEKAGDLCEEGVLKKPYQPEEVVRRIGVLRAHRRTSRIN